MTSAVLDLWEAEWSHVRVFSGQSSFTHLPHGPALEIGDDGERRGKPLDSGEASVVTPAARLGTELAEAL